MSMEVYAQANSKAHLNRMLSAGDPVSFTHYRILDVTQYSFEELQEGTIVKVYSKTDYAGTPIAKSYGVVRGGKVQ